MLLPDVFIVLQETLMMFKSATESSVISVLIFGVLIQYVIARLMDDTKGRGQALRAWGIASVISCVAAFVICYPNNILFGYAAVAIIIVIVLGKILITSSST